MNRQFSIATLFNPRIFKFLCVGVLNTVFGYTLYVILIFFNVPCLTALFVATVGGAIFNYFSFGRIVFHSSGGLFVFGKFILAYGIVYAANAGLLKALTKDFLFSPYVGQGICIPLSVLLIWLLMNYWVYKNGML